MKYSKTNLTFYFKLNIENLYFSSLITMKLPHKRDENLSD